MGIVNMVDKKSVFFYKVVFLCFCRDVIWELLLFDIGKNDSCGKDVESVLMIEWREINRGECVRVRWE